MSAWPAGGSACAARTVVTATRVSSPASRHAALASTAAYSASRTSARARTGSPSPALSVPSPASLAPTSATSTQASQSADARRHAGAVPKRAARSRPVRSVMLESQSQRRFEPGSNHRTCRVFPPLSSFWGSWPMSNSRPATRPVRAATRSPPSPSGSGASRQAWQRGRLIRIRALSPPIITLGLVYAVGRGRFPSDSNTTIRNRSTLSPMPGCRLSRFPATMSVETRDSRMNSAMCRGVVKPGLTHTQDLPKLRQSRMKPRPPGELMSPNIKAA